jgi:tetratricopeptide (TPR) repeat protein
MTKHISVLPIMLVGIATALFLLFVYGYTRLFPLIEASHPDHFEKNVADAIAEENIRKALRIARRSITRAHFWDPLPYTMYGRALLESGDTDKALEQLRNAVRLTQEPPPSNRRTRKPYYFQPARHTLGAYYLEQGQTLEAIENFELARAYPVENEDGEFDKAQYQAYATQGIWARALEFAEPSDQELDDLDSRELVRIAQISEGEQNWERVTRMAERLLAREALAADAHHFLGLADFASEQYESSLTHLEQALSGGHEHAAFFLGMARAKASDPAEAVQAFLRTRPGDVYRPFALANALALLPKLTQAQRNQSGATRRELLDQLDGEIFAMRALQRPILYDEYRRITPVAFKTSKAHFAAGGRFPIFVLWEDGQSPPGATILKLWPEVGLEDSRLLLQKSNSILQLQWVENAVNWESIERLPAGASVIPGWIDTAREWFDVRTDRVARVQQDDSGNSFLGSIKPTWYYSLPIPVRDGKGYLFAGRLRAPNNRGGLRWQTLDAAEHVLFEDRIFQQQSTDQWLSQASYMRSRLHWDSLRVQLEVWRGASGTVGFDDIMLAEIDEPSPRTAGVDF